MQTEILAVLFGWLIVVACFASSTLISGTAFLFTGHRGGIGATLLRRAMARLDAQGRRVIAAGAAFGVLSSITLLTLMALFGAPW